jgi:hypothetical protein
MSVFRNLEARIEGLVEGVFSRAFSSEVQPVELARKLAREMDSHKTASVSRVYVPNEYTVHLSSRDREKLEGYERSLGQELSGYLLEHARSRGYDLLSRPEVKFNTDDRLRLGEFGIQTRLVKAPAREGERAQPAEEGRTMVYAAPPRQPQRPSEPPPAPTEAPRAVIVVNGRRRTVAGPRSVVGRSDAADFVITDPNISRRHAELRQSPDGEWEIVDLNSTNGVKVNGRRLPAARLRDGDQVTLGTTTFRFGLER